MGMIKDMVGGFETLLKIGRCASNGTLNIILSTLGYGEDPDEAILLIFYPSCILRRVDMAKILNYDKGVVFCTFCFKFKHQHLLRSFKCFIVATAYVIPF